MKNISSYLERKLKNQHQTPYENAQPSLRVNVARAKSAIQDSSYFTVETIREKQGLGDIEVGTRRQKSHGSPDGLFDIHVHSGVVSTSFRAYPDRLKEGWKDQFDVGLGSSVSIAFDGFWEQYRDGWGFVTEKFPWIYWVDSNKNLYMQHWDKGGTKELVSPGTKKVKALRGWKTLESIDKDQGIVIAYIKENGKVYYRQYIQLIDLSYVLTPEIEITLFKGIAVDFNLFLTNDYRLGITVEDNSGKVYWYITKRNYSAMTTGTESFSLDVGLRHITFDVKEIKNYSYNIPTEVFKLPISTKCRGFALQDVSVGYVDIKIIQAQIINQTQFILQFNYPIKMWLDAKPIEFVKDLDLKSVEVVNDTITYTIKSTFGYGDRLINTVPNVVLGLNVGNEYFFPGGEVLVKGLKVPLKPTEETLNLNIEKSELTFKFIPVFTHSYNVPSETLNLKISISFLKFEITEVSKEPI